MNQESSKKPSDITGFVNFVAPNGEFREKALERAKKAELLTWLKEAHQLILDFTSDGEASALQYEALQRSYDLMCARSRTIRRELNSMNGTKVDNTRPRLFKLSKEIQHEPYIFQIETSVAGATNVVSRFGCVSLVDAAKGWDALHLVLGANNTADVCDVPSIYWLDEPMRYSVTVHPGCTEGPDGSFDEREILDAEFGFVVYSLEEAIYLQQDLERSVTYDNIYVAVNRLSPVEEGVDPIELLQMLEMEIHEGKAHRAYVGEFLEELPNVSEAPIVFEEEDILLQHEASVDPHTFDAEEERIGESLVQFEGVVVSSWPYLDSAQGYHLKAEDGRTANAFVRKDSLKPLIPIGSKMIVQVEAEAISYPEEVVDETCDGNCADCFCGRSTHKHFTNLF